MGFFHILIFMWVRKKRQHACGVIQRNAVLAAAVILLLYGGLLRVFGMTADLLEAMLVKLKDEGEEAAFRYIKEDVL